MLMVKAGSAVDEFIEHLLPHLEAGDIIIDGGNSLFEDTNRRVKYVESKGLLYIGTGVSGGEEGARHGPSIMPGGSPAAWPHVKDIFQGIAAKVDGAPCCDWVGEGGAGHYVKMVHNGIEYGDMQLIGEAYNLMKTGLGLSADRDARNFCGMEQGRTEFLPHRNHPRHSGLQRYRRPAARGQDPRHCRPKGHGQMDGGIPPTWAFRSR
jgi:6-phosphogluconate dehydrogenase